MIPFVDLQVQYHAIKQEIDSAISRVIEHGQFVLGPEVSAFEDEFADYCGVRHAIAVNSGTSALHLALLAAGIGPGDEVITVSFTFVATVAAIGYTGAQPVFVDIDPRSCTMDANQVEAAITDRTKAIIPVHLYGQSADMDSIMSIARRHSLIVIEDAAQAHGALYKNRRTGSIGNLGAFSFYPAKNLGAYGEGGAVTTNDADYAHTIRLLRDWGQEHKYHHVLKGYNYRMEGIQGAVLRIKLRHLDSWNAARRNHAHTYRNLLANSKVKLLDEMDYGLPVYHIFPIFTPRRDAMKKYLEAAGVSTGIHYPIPVHLQSAYRDLGYQQGDFPHTERAGQETLSLPMYAEIGREALSTIAISINQFENSARADQRSN